MENKKIFNLISINLVAWTLSLILVAPLILILFNALKTSLLASEMSLAFPQMPIQWSNFSIVIEKGKLIQSFVNSTIYSVGSVLLCTGLSAMCAYVLSRNRNKLNKFIYIFIVLGIAMPINFVTLMKVMQSMQLMNSTIGIILLYAAVQTPFTIFLIYGFIGKIPVDLDEAGIIDGCTPLKLFFKIILPLLKPVLVTTIVLTFLNTWNEFIIPLYFLNSSAKWPMTLAVYNFFGMYFKDWNLVSADIVLTSLPVIIVYLLGQKYIVAGMTSGAVKG
ncbi:carbohydrate ABC transporter permease [Cellulosilyticum sp. I15G10I2]|uniref:carbohydrate ABC transporter permease n=1 Tax=Cellulosilyticum sp. I15G10I2 TaxID=1892843 RepID=UPI00085C809E|nr:carbohydrate ABC transporter permease [Cellulosilyticum sp. I15G10I2]